MPDAPRTTIPADIEGAWYVAHDTARRVRESLLACGIPEAELNLLTARATVTGPPRVILPPLSLESAERLLTALSPFVGPCGPHLGRSTAPTLPAGHPA